VAADGPKERAAHFALPLVGGEPFGRAGGGPVAPTGRAGVVAVAVPGNAAGNESVPRLFSRYKLRFERRLGFDAVADVGCDRKAGSRTKAEREGTATR
jgi:hypothetical protein